MADVVVRVDINESALRELRTGRATQDVLMELARPIVARAKVLAPKRSGRGAESIRAEPVIEFDRLSVRISWTKDRYYMYFHDRGWNDQPGSRFLETALEQELGG